jgi:LAO/AO transport system kinase
LKITSRLPVEAYVEGILSGDRVILSRAITLVESTLPQDQLLAENVVEKILPYSGKSIRIGITGVPGVGKSTFIEGFGKLLVEMGYKLAVLTVDPSSQKSHGSILGDKTRMEKLSSDKRAYIRPSPAGVSLGGVSARTREAMLLCEAAGFNIILIETVGVGQSEIAVKGMVDFFLLLMLAGAGDELQGIKKGIIEMCDALVINKADGENITAAKKAQREYTNALHLFPVKENGWNPKVLTCSAIDQIGLSEIWQMIEGFVDQMKRTNYMDINRSNQLEDWLYDHIGYLLKSSFYENEEIKSSITRNLPKIKAGNKSPIGLARELVEAFIDGISRK